MNNLEKRAAEQNKTIEEYTVTVKSTEEHDALVAKIKEQGGEIIATFPMKGEGFSVQYRILSN